MKIICAVLASVIVFSGFIYAVSEKPKYYRQECIQQVIFDWESYSPSEVESVIDRISKVLHEAWSARSESVVDVPAYTFPFSQRNEWYLQYHKDCHEKKEKTTWLIKHVIEPNFKKFPSYEVTDKVVTPSPRTISVTGEFWKKDKYK